MMASSALVRTLAAPHPRGSAAARPAPAANRAAALSCSVRGNGRQVGLLSVGGGAPRRGSVACKAQEAALEVPDVTTSTWQEQVLGSDVAVLVEFWAPWCGPCRMMHPVIGKLSKIYEGKLKCFKLNTDENQEVASQYGIRSIPTIIIFKDGEKKEATIGAVPESNLVTTIEKYIAN